MIIQFLSTFILASISVSNAQLDKNCERAYQDVQQCSATTSSVTFCEKAVVDKCLQTCKLSKDKEELSNNRMNYCLLAAAKLDPQAMEKPAQGNSALYSNDTISKLNEKLNSGKSSDPLNGLSATIDGDLKERNLKELRLQYSVKIPVPGGSDTSSGSR